MFKRRGWVRIWYMKMSLTAIRTWNRLIRFVKYRLIQALDSQQAARKLNALSVCKFLSKCCSLHISCCFPALWTQVILLSKLTKSLSLSSRFKCYPVDKRCALIPRQMFIFSTVRFSINLNPLVLEKRFSWTTYSSITD